MDARDKRGHDEEGFSALVRGGLEHDDFELDATRRHCEPRVQPEVGPKRTYCEPGTNRVQFLASQSQEERQAAAAASVVGPPIPGHKEQNQ